MIYDKQTIHLRTQGFFFQESTTIHCIGITYGRIPHEVRVNRLWSIVYRVRFNMFKQKIYELCHFTNSRNINNIFYILIDTWFHVEARWFPPINRTILSTEKLFKSMNMNPRFLKVLKLLLNLSFERSINQSFNSFPNYCIKVLFLCSFL